MGRESRLVARKEKLYVELPISDPEASSPTFYGDTHILEECIMKLA